MELYNYKYLNNAGKEIETSTFKDQVVLIVNVASKCGFTPQYADLELIYKDFNSKGLKIIAFPCNQFGEQEPGTDEEIKEFCTINYNVTFDIASKVEVNGKNAHPLYVYLKNVAKNGNEIDWNFEKFLIHKDGKVENFNPNIDMGHIRSSIEISLSK